MAMEPVLRWKVTFHSEPGSSEQYEALSARRMDPFPRSTFGRQAARDPTTSLGAHLPDVSYNPLSMNINPLADNIRFSGLNAVGMSLGKQILIRW